MMHPETSKTTRHNAYNLHGDQPTMSLTNLPANRSSWISDVGYVPIPGCDAVGALAIFLKPRATKSHPTPHTSAILYVNIPSHIPGLLISGRVVAKDDGELSVGAAYSRLVRGKYPSEVIEDEEKVRELKEMMEKGGIVEKGGVA